MKIIAVCSKCMFGHGGARQFLDAHLSDSGVAYFTCPQGHRGATIVQMLKMEMLFQSGCMALVEGFTMEAVSSLAAALERGLELYIRVICRKRGLAPDALEKMWKHIGKQSERQLGAFQVLYCLETGEAFQFPGSRAEFRNKVIHQGFVPSPAKAVKYAEWVRERICHLLQILEETASAELEQLRMEEHANKYAGATDIDGQPSVLGMKSLLDPSDQRTLGESLCDLANLMKSVNAHHHISVTSSPQPVAGDSDDA
jgi:hypothetical protein